MVFRIPSAEESLLTFGKSSLKTWTGELLHILVWNVWKGKSGARWRQDFEAIASDRDIILLQEAVSEPHMTEIFEADHGVHEWHMAASFRWRDAYTTGVITGAGVQPRQRKFFRGTKREFFLWTPKITLGTHYELQNGEDLLVINTHVVNFTTTSAFVHYVEELVQMISEHKGPLILAGDFNTWGFRRWESLLNVLAHLNLQPISFGEDPRFLKLDHVFVRGLKPVRAQIRGDITSSDHYPLLVDLRF